MSDKGFRIEIPVHIKRDRRARKVLATGEAPKPEESAPRAARLLALAHKWEGMVRQGEIVDHAQIARLTGLTKGRVSQICSLTLLAPAIQEAMLDPTLKRNPFSVRVLRQVLVPVLWDMQDAEWRQRVDPASSIDA